MREAKRFCKGGVLLVVLGVLAAMGVVVSLLASYTLERALLAETRGAESISGVNIKLSSAIETGVAALSAFEEVAGSLHSPSEGWGVPAEVMSGWPSTLEGVTVEIFDESSKPGLSLLAEDDLKELLDEAGFSKGEASELGDLLLDWIDEDSDQRFQGRENSAVGRDDDLWIANRPPRSWDEVWEIPEWKEVAFDEEGNLRDWASRFSSLFSLDHDLPANINTVDRDLVEWLSEANLISNPLWLDRRDGRDNELGSEDDRILTEIPEEASLGDLFSAESQVLRIRASAEVGERSVWKEVWISRETESDNDRGSEDPDIEIPSEPELDLPRENDESNGEGAAGVWGEWTIFDVRGGLALSLEEGAEEE
ncbi:MAG: hypothetical protein AAGJ81_11945 [Verrucomicrobiota bacterium]